MMDKKKFVYLEKDQKLDKEQVRKSLTYWQDVWRRLRRNYLAIIGLVGVVLVILFATVGQSLNSYTYYSQYRDYKNVPPRLNLYEIEEGEYVFMSGMFELYKVSEDGEFIGLYTKSDQAFRQQTYTYIEDDKTIVIVAAFYPSTDTEPITFDLDYDGEVIKYDDVHHTTWNKTFILGTDLNGRDLLARVMYGTGISLLIAFVAAIINLFIGVIYGSVAGYSGGTTDIVMMRIVDIINSIPLLLYVILLMVVLKESWFEENILSPIFGEGGLGNIIITLISVYWVGMARLVRGQILGIKEQEYVLAAKTIGVSHANIIRKHLVPNALGPIIVALTMMIPSAVFTEAFLSFIGLGINAPRASLGSLASDGAQFMQTYPYQLVVPSLVIAFMMLSFNFLGDGLRDALDPRLRKG